jgi:hypothetical protein
VRGFTCRSCAPRRASRSRNLWSGGEWCGGGQQLVVTVSAFEGASLGCPEAGERRFDLTCPAGSAARRVSCRLSKRETCTMVIRPDQSINWRSRVSPSTDGLRTEREQMRACRCRGMLLTIRRTWHVVRTERTTTILCVGSATGEYRSACLLHVVLVW